MKKGFTMVELLAIIIIVGTIGIMSFASLTNTIKKNKVREQEVFETNIINAAKLYLASHLDDFSTIDNDDFKAIITTNSLISEKYLKENMANPYDTNIYFYYVEVQKGDEGYLEYVLKYSEAGTLDAYKDPVLNGADPVLDAGMVPIYYDGNEVKVANKENEWYNYTNKKWANAILVKEEKRNYYLAAKGGTVVNTDDILGYFVWIPRYKYLIPNSATGPRSISITFQNSKETKESGNAVSAYYTHPAFTYNGKELNGIWVAKFETTGTDLNPTVLPSNASLTAQNVANKYKTSKLFKNYGLKSNASRMMKNSEWGATVYLSHSIYGLNGEVANNGNSNYTTGCGSVNNTESTTNCINKFGTSTSYPQSTTGNIYGIFDMAGGAWEIVMGNYNKNVANSGFSKMPNDKYYDLYTSTNITGLGHALEETQNWYSDYSSNLTTSEPWIGRGGSVTHYENAGIFFYTLHEGSENLGDPKHTFRVVLSLG